MTDSDDVSERNRPWFRSSVDRDTSENEGLTIYLKVDYKVILLVVVIFDILHFSINELVQNYL